MKISDTLIGGTFYCGGRPWHCTDIGTRVIVAIPLFPVATTRFCATTGIETIGLSDDSWLSGPPYALNETVFDEDDLIACSLEPETD